MNEKTSFKFFLLFIKVRFILNSSFWQDAKSHQKIGQISNIAPKMKNS